MPPETTIASGSSSATAPANARPSWPAGRSSAVRAGWSPARAAAISAAPSAWPKPVRDAVERAARGDALQPAAAILAGIVHVGARPTERTGAAARSGNDAAIGEHRRAYAGADRQQDRVRHALGRAGACFGQQRDLGVVADSRCAGLETAPACRARRDRADWESSGRSCLRQARARQSRWPRCRRPWPSMRRAGRQTRRGWPAPPHA